MPQKPNPETMDLLHALLNRSKPSLDPTKAPPIPASMLPQPPTVGNKDFLMAVKELTDKFPETKRTVSQFRQGPTEGSMQSMVDSKLPIDEFANTNLLGVFNTRDKSIGVNPGVIGDMIASVLAHEGAHSQGSDELYSKFAGLARLQPQKSKTEIAKMVIGR